MHVRLTAVVGLNLSLSSVVKQMIKDKEYWRAFLAFCETVMSAKKEGPSKITTSSIKEEKDDCWSLAFCMHPNFLLLYA